MTAAFVLGGVRTPFTRYGGSLSHIRLDDLLGLAMTGACERVGVGLDQSKMSSLAASIQPTKEWATWRAGRPWRRVFPIALPERRSTGSVLRR